MSLITSDLGGITFAVTSALAVGPAKAVFYGIGVCYGISTFYHACQIYIESYYMMPSGACKRLVVIMAITFYTSWFMFPSLFLAGPEGTGALTWSGTTIAHTFADLLSKNMWGIFGHFLRVKIHEHILIHGDVRRPMKVNVLGKEYNLNCFVTDEEQEDDERTSTAHYANRSSFIKMKENMEQKGIRTRGSIEVGKAAVAPLRDGTVVVAASDPSTHDFFARELGKMDASIAAAPSADLQQLQNLLSKGGVDGVLISPEFLQQPGLVQALKHSFRTPVFAFGWSKSGPAREVIESSGVDGWLEGPAFGVSFEPANLRRVLLQMQAAQAPHTISGPAQQPWGQSQIGAIGGGNGWAAGGMHHGMNPAAAHDPSSPMVGSGGQWQSGQAPAEAGAQQQFFRDPGLATGDPRQMMMMMAAMQQQQQQQQYGQQHGQFMPQHLQHPGQAFQQQQQQQPQAYEAPPAPHQHPYMQAGGTPTGMQSPSGMQTPSGVQTPMASAFAAAPAQMGTNSPEAVASMMQQLQYMQMQGWGQQ
eukprot:CAMPEP_0177608700 /NCGR_PEP_ID=MMETSP0419_2-20121207/18620_1 /TAXON_ID=582737 /ORGANISM="Tetraselmis sp., Strain GSL018" /LENGTH=530 /DNA_ID=CAMNT_0019103425 /DNA_START=465 /DNA_END=2057 /DNA_ORIENTATION=+